MTTKIALVMIHYPVAMGRYFWEALIRRPDTELWSAGPFSGRWIPWSGGINLSPNYVREPDYPTPMPQGPPPVLPYGLLEGNCPWKPDLWLEINAGLRTHGRPSGKYAIVASDPHVLPYAEERAKADYFFTMQKPYMQPGEHWLPYAYDPVFHSPSPVPMKDRAYDASLVGLGYPNRVGLFTALARMGMNTYFGVGPAYGDAREIYHQTKAGINWSSLKDTTARVFELMALGTVPILNRVPDLTEMFVEDQDYLGFSTMEEAIQKVDYVIRNPDKAEALAANAKQAVAPHTWDSRIEQILRETETIGG